MPHEILKELFNVEEVIDPNYTSIITRKQGKNLATEFLGGSPEDIKYFLTDDNGRELRQTGRGFGHIKARVLEPDESGKGTIFESFDEATDVREYAKDTWHFAAQLKRAQDTKER